MNLRKNTDWEKKKPWAEWRFPLMLVTTSSVIFVLLVSAFGVTIHSQTGEVTMYMDWSQYYDEKTGLYDPWVYNPMTVWIQDNRLPVFISFIAGFYFVMTAVIYCWFDYMKWKWEKIPVEYKTQIKVKNKIYYTDGAKLEKNRREKNGIRKKS